MNPFLSVYCERAGLAGALAEPLNAITNLAFLVAAVLAWRAVRDHPEVGLRRGWDIAALAAVVFVIGLGSAAWHVWPIRPTLLADVIPITIFIHAYMAAFVIRVLRLAWPWAIAIVVAYVAASLSVPSLLSPRALQGTAAYLPAYAMLAIMCGVLFVTANGQRWRLAAALGIWTVSLTLRSIDGVACAWTPTGTHFAWHLLNAVVLYTLLSVLIASFGDGKGWLPGPDSNQRPSG